MTSHDLDLLLPALHAATGCWWREFADWSGGRLRAVPVRLSKRVRKYVLVGCWPIPGRRRIVVVGDEFSTIPAGRGWPDRAAAAVVEMLGERR